MPVMFPWHFSDLVVPSHFATDTHTHTHTAAGFWATKCLTSSTAPACFLCMSHVISNVNKTAVMFVHGRSSGRISVVMNVKSSPTCKCIGDSVSSNKKNTPFFLCTGEIHNYFGCSSIPFGGPRHNCRLQVVGTFRASGFSNFIYIYICRLLLEFKAVKLLDNKRK